MSQDNNDLLGSADVYYRSNQRSTVGSANAMPQQRHGRVGQPVRAIATPNFNPEDTNADKYYQNGGSRVGARPQGAEVPVAARGGGAVGISADDAGDDAGVTNLNRTLRAATREGVRDAVQQAIALFQAGQRAVTIEVAEDRFTADAQTQLDLAEARGEITTAQAHGVRFAPIPRSGKEIAERSFGRIEDVASRVPAAADEDPLPADFEAFVKGTAAPTSVTAATPGDGGLSGLDEQGD